MKTDMLLLLALLIAAIGGVYLLSSIPVFAPSVTTDTATDISTAPKKAQSATDDIEQQPLVVSRTSITLLGWIPYWDQEKAVMSFKRNVELFDYVSVFWYRLDLDGNIKTYSNVDEDQSIIDFAHQNGVKVLAVVANLPDYTEGGSWDLERVDRVITVKEERQHHIADLVTLTKEFNFDGINIDYEALKRSQRDDFTLFIKELSVALHSEGKLLGVAIHPKTSEFNPAEDNGSHAQDLKALYPVVDQLYFMTYEEHYDESPPGPVASIDWVDRVLDYAVNKIGVPPEKIFLGIPQYGYNWPLEHSGAGGRRAQGLTYNDVKNLIVSFQPDVQFDEESSSPFFSYGSQSEGEHIVWFENNESFEAKLMLREKYQIPNLAIWRLGSEDPLIWKTLLEERQN